MLFEQKHSNRASAVVYRRLEGKCWVLLHLARGTRSKHKSSKQQLSLPEAPRSWIALTAKSFRPGGAIGNLEDCARKKCVWKDKLGKIQHMRIEQRAVLFADPEPLYGRYHHWLLCEMIEPTMPIQIDSKYFEATVWFNHETILSVAQSETMTVGWKNLFQGALFEATQYEPDLLPIHRAFQDARF